MCEDSEWPQAGRTRLIAPAPISMIGKDGAAVEMALLAQLDDAHVFMMGDNPVLPRMPDKPTLLDFFHLRFTGVTRRHLLNSAKAAIDDGLDDKIVFAVLVHDIANACLIRADHGYWGAQLIAPYVDEEISWAVRYHQPLRYFADPAAGYEYPESYLRFFGADYVPPDYIRAAAEEARRHRWYMSSRLVTIYDRYFFEDGPEPDPMMFEDIIGRHFRQPAEGLGFDNSPTAHMWRTMIWPHNFL
jgi:hypothetical protein